MSSVSGVEQLKPGMTALADLRSVPDWLLNLREAGSASVLREGLPTRSLEAWKYTNLAPLLEGTWESAEAFAADELPARNLFPTWSAASSGDVVLLNGVFLNEWSKIPARVRVRTSNQLEESPVRTPSLKPEQAWSAKTGTPEKQVMQVSLNAAFMRDLVVIDIEPGTVLKEPLVISTFSFGTESLTKWSASAPRVVINVPPGCDIAVVEMTGGRRSHGFGSRHSLEYR